MARVNKRIPKGSKLIASKTVISRPRPLIPYSKKFPEKKHEKILGKATNFTQLPRSTAHHLWFLSDSPAKVQKTAPTTRL